MLRGMQAMGSKMATVRTFYYVRTKRRFIRY